MTSLRPLWRVLLLVAGLALVAGAPLSHSGYGFGFFTWFGFVSCAVLVFVARLIGFAIKRKETYYGAGDAEVRDD